MVNAARSVTALRRYRKYQTYQARFEVFGASEGSTVDIFRLTVLRVLIYLNKRADSSLVESLPDPDDFDAGTYDLHGFDPAAYGADFAASFTGIEAEYYEGSDGTFWNIQITEPDNGLIGSKVDDREFITDYAVRYVDGRVYLAIRTLCKEPDIEVAHAEAIRPALINQMLSDGRLKLAEETLPEEYAFGSVPHELNANSVQGLADFSRCFIDNRRVAMPIILIPENAFIDSGATLEQAARISESAKGYAHTFLVKGPYRKMTEMIFNGVPVDMIKVLTDGDIFVITRRREDIFSPRVISTADYRGIEKKIVDEINSAVAPDNLLPAVKLPEEIKDKAPLPQKEEGQAKIKALREEEAKKIVENIRSLHHWFMRRKIVNYDGVYFCDDIRIRKIMESGDKEAQIASLAREKKDLQEQLNEMTARYNDRVGKVSEVNDRVKKLEGDLAVSQREIDELKVENNSLSGEVYAKDDGGGLVISRGPEGLIEPRDIFPLFKMPDPKDGGSAVVQWVETYYTDTLIVTDKARREMESIRGNIKDWRTLCFMLHFLSGYTIVKREKPNAMNDDPDLRKYDVAQMNLKVTPVGNSPTDFPKEYSASFGSKEYILRWHIKSGNTEGKDMLRIYFDYDRELGKSVIGAMPGHLSVLGYK